MDMSSWCDTSLNTGTTLPLPVQNQSQMNGDNLSNVRHEMSRTFWNQKGNT